MAGVLATTAPVNQAHAILSSSTVQGRVLNVVLRVLGGDGNSIRCEVYHH